MASRSSIAETAIGSLLGGGTGYALEDRINPETGGRAIGRNTLLGTVGGAALGNVSGSVLRGRKLGLTTGEALGQTVLERLSQTGGIAAPHPVERSGTKQYFIDSVKGLPQSYIDRLREVARTNPDVQSEVDEALKSREKFRPFGIGIRRPNMQKTSMAEYSVLFDKVASGELGEHARQALYGICQGIEAPVTSEKTASISDVANLSESDARKARLDQLLKR